MLSYIMLLWEGADGCALSLSCLILRESAVVISIVAQFSVSVLTALSGLALLTANGK